MRKAKQLSAAVITASFLAIQLVQPAHTAWASTAKVEAPAVKPSNATPSPRNQSIWDQSSLSFASSDIHPNEVAATVKNVGSQPMRGDAVYEVYRSEQGNPKTGQVVGTGVIHAMLPGETQRLTYTPKLLVPGVYSFKAYQRPGHPGRGELWSPGVNVTEYVAAPESAPPVSVPPVSAPPERPYDQYFNSNVEGSTATFTVPEGIEPVEISFTSYVYPEGVQPQEGENPYVDQVVYNNVTDTYGPGTYTVQVEMPESGFWQTDLYLGPVIETLTETGHPMDKIIDADSSLADETAQ